MAENGKKIVDQILDDEGKPVDLSGDIILDKTTGKSFAEHAADANAHLTKEAVNTLIETGLKPLQTTLNAFLSGDPDDNGTLDRLKELVAAINANKDNIDKLLDVANSGTGIAFVDSAEAEPEYTGKLRMVISDYTAPAGE